MSPRFNSILNSKAYRQVNHAALDRIFRPTLTLCGSPLTAQTKPSNTDSARRRELPLVWIPTHLSLFPHSNPCTHSTFCLPLPPYKTWSNTRFRHRSSLFKMRPLLKSHQHPACHPNPIHQQARATTRLLPQSRGQCLTRMICQHEPRIGILRTRDRH